MLADDLAAFGIQAPDEDEEDGLFEVDDDNWQAVLMFSRCGTQWRYGAMGGVMGMDYPGVKTVLDLTVDGNEHKAVFESIQVMERAAMAVINERAAKSPKRP